MWTSEKNGKLLLSWKSAINNYNAQKSTIVKLNVGGFGALDLALGSISNLCVRDLKIDFLSG